jgi:hypothetical protein
MTDIVLGVIGALALVRGVWLGFRGKSGASSWLALGSAFALALGTRIHGDVNDALALFVVAGVGVTAAGTLLVRELLGARDRRLALADADDDEVRGLMREAHDTTDDHRLTDVLDDA